MKVLVWLVLFLWAAPTAAAPVTLTRAQLEKISRAMKRCKADREIHKVRLQAAGQKCSLKVKRAVEICKVEKQGNPWIGVALFTGGVVLGGVLTGVFVWQVTK